MPHYRFPTFVWRDASGAYNASLLEWSEPVAFGRTLRDALEDLREYVSWRYRDCPWLDAPDLDDVRHEVLRVPVRPEYGDEKRRYPLPEPILLKVHCVHGKQSHGQRLAVLPFFDRRFYYHADDPLPQLVAFTVQQALEGKTPQELSRFVPPEFVQVESIGCQAPRYDRAPQVPDDPQTLRAVAEPLGETRVRSLYGHAWERDELVRRLVARLTEERGNVLLVGEPGSGKTTVLAAAVRQIERQLAEADRRDESLRVRRSRRFWQTSAARLIAGMKYLGQWEERMEEVISELGEREGVLCIDSLPDLIRTGGSEPAAGLAAFCVPYLQRRELRMVAEVSPTELDACRRLLPGLAELFQIVPVEPLDPETATQVLQRQGANFARTYPIEVAESTAREAVQLYSRFLPYQALPGGASSFFRTTCERSLRDRLPAVTPDLMRTRFIEQTGLREVFLREDLPLRRADVLSAIHEDVIGQPDACDAVANVVLRFKAGLCDPRRPVGVLLFCGPTGVGKTETAKSLARFLFGAVDRNKPRLIRLDMSEYSGPWAAERLLRQPTGEPSDFIQRVRQQPFSVILLDEIEKADHAVFDVLLSVCDEGRVTDRWGSTTYVRSAVIILTTNLGAGQQGTVGFGAEEPAAAAAMTRFATAVREFFRPEFFNRLDRLVTFQPLTADVIRQITEKELRQIAGREGLRRAGLTLEWTPAAVDALARAGFNPRYGARPLHRALESLVVTPLSHAIVGRPEWRDRRLCVDVDAEKRITIRPSNKSAGAGL